MYQRLGYVSQATERLRHGAAQHQAHARQVRRARLWRVVGFGLVLGGLALLAAWLALALVQGGG